MIVNAEQPLTIQPSANKIWKPKRIIFTADALDEPYGQEIWERVTAAGLATEVATNNRLTGLRGATERETYKLAKSTLAVVKAPPSQFKLQPIPPSADWQFHLAQGCPAHCHYCYLAGSLSGPPVVKVYANLPQILDNLQTYTQPGRTTTFEASCYTDILAIEHLTGGLQKTIKHFGTMQNAQLRFVSKFTVVDDLLSLQHNTNTRARLSVNLPDIARRLEGGTPPVAQRIEALRKLALPVAEGGGSYPIGIVLAPIMPVDGWEDAYSLLLDDLQQALHFAPDITFELITHRYTEGSRNLLQEWYPATSLNMTGNDRSKKLNKFGGVKYVYNSAMMKTLKQFFYTEIQSRLPQAKILYWT